MYIKGKYIKPSSIISYTPIVIQKQPLSITVGSGGKVATFIWKNSNWYYLD
jgi:hypothetical protein